MWILIIALLAAGVPAVAEPWDVLMGLRAGSRVRVQDDAGAQHAGVLRAVTAGAISMEEGNQQVAIERVRVRKVKVKSTSRRVRNLLIGAGIGVAVGVVVDQSLGAYLRNESGEDNRALSYVAPIAVFTAIGAAMPGYQTVWRAR